MNAPIADPSAVEVCPVPIALILTDADLQARTLTSPTVVSDYADAIRRGATFPPVILFYDGRRYYPGDGLHRIQASREAGLDSIVAEVRSGTADDARWHACGANQTHGLRRTSADKRRAVEIALALHPEHSDRMLAEHCGVGYSLVADVRRQLPESGSSSARVGKDGKARRPPPAKPRMAILGGVPGHPDYWMFALPSAASGGEWFNTYGGRGADGFAYDFRPCSAAGVRVIAQIEFGVDPSQMVWHERPYDDELQQLHQRLALSSVGATA